jgi:hypothetical protein
MKHNLDLAVIRCCFEDPYMAAMIRTLFIPFDWLDTTTAVL